MSQHIFVTTNGQILLAGYDRQNGELFFSLFPDEDTETPSAESRGGIVQISDLQQSIEALVPAVPAAMFESIRQDAINNVGNRVVKWSPEGTILSDSAACGRKVA